MKTIAVTFGLLLAAGPAMAASPFDGAWKLDMATAKAPERPSVFSLKDGVFACTSCVPAYSIPADGRFHAVKDNPYADTRAISVIDPQTVMMVNMKDGRIVLNGMLHLSADGQEMNTTYVDSSTAAGAVTSSSRQRLSPGPAGSHPISGSWRITKYGEASDNALLMNLAVDGDSVKFDGLGLTYQAKVGGPAVPLVGDIAGTQITVRRPSPSVIEETSLIKGKVVLVQTYAVADDGKTLKLQVDDKETGATSAYPGVKQ